MEVEYGPGGMNVESKWVLIETFEHVNHVWEMLGLSRRDIQYTTA